MGGRWLTLLLARAWIGAVWDGRLSISFDHPTTHLLSLSQNILWRNDIDVVRMFLHMLFGW